MVLGVDLVDEDSADRLLGPKKKKAKWWGRVISKSESDYKIEEGEEELPAWQDKPVLPARHVNTTGTTWSNNSDNSDSWYSSNNHRNGSRYNTCYLLKYSQSVRI